MNIFKIIIYWIVLIGRWLSQTLTLKIILKYVWQFIPLLFLKIYFFVFSIQHFYICRYTDNDILIMTFIY